MRGGILVDPCQLLNLKHITRRISLPESNLYNYPISTEVWLNNEPKAAETDKSPIKSNSTELENKSFRQRYIGIFLAILATFLFALSSLLVKVLSARYHVFNITLWRYIGPLLPTIALVLYSHNHDKKANIFESVWPISKPGSKKTMFLIMLRSVSNCTGILLLFFSFKYITIADASVIGYSAPIMVTIAAYFILHEALSVVQIITSLVALVGVVIIARPPFLSGSEEFDMDNLLGTGISFVAVMLRVVTMICLRYLRDSHYLLIILVIAIWGAIQSFAMTLFVGELELPEEITDWVLGLCLGLVSFFGRIFLTIALKHETSGVIALVQCLDIVFAFIFQFIFLGTHPDTFSIVGASLVLLSVGVVGFRKWLCELPEGHPKRIRFRLLLK